LVWGIRIKLALQWLRDISLIHGAKEIVLLLPQYDASGGHH
jgi:hypothetical protein